MTSSDMFGDALHVLSSFHVGYEIALLPVWSALLQKHKMDSKSQQIRIDHSKTLNTLIP